MITVGIDMGARNVKVVVLDQGVVMGRAVEAAGFATAASARQAVDAALSRAALPPDQVPRVFATGAGRTEAPQGARPISEVHAAALGMFALHPEAATVVDVGAEEARAIHVARGEVLDFAVNDRCASGTGAFAEAMARALQVPVPELGPLSLKSTRKLRMSAQCAVFAETEAVSMIHDNVPAADIARAVHDAIARRVAPIVRRIGSSLPVALCGGMGRNVGFVEALRRALELDDLLVPEEPELVLALGAALAAARA